MYVLIVWIMTLFVYQTHYAAAHNNPEKNFDTIVGASAPKDRMLVTHTACHSKKLSHFILSTHDTRLTTATLERFLASITYKSSVRSATNMAQELYKGLQYIGINPTACAIAQIILTEKSCTVRHYTGLSKQKSTLKAVEQTLTDTKDVAYIQTTDASTFLLKSDQLTVSAQRIAEERHDPDAPLSLIIDIDQWRTYCQTVPAKKSWWHKIVN